MNELLNIIAFLGIMLVFTFGMLFIVGLGILDTSLRLGSRIISRLAPRLWEQALADRAAELERRYPDDHLARRPGFPPGAVAQTRHCLSLWLVVTPLTALLLAGPTTLEIENADVREILGYVCLASFCVLFLLSDSLLMRRHFHLGIRITAGLSLIHLILTVITWIVLSLVVVAVVPDS